MSVTNGCFRVSALLPTVADEAGFFLYLFRFYTGSNVTIYVTTLLSFLVLFCFLVTVFFHVKIQWFTGHVATPLWNLSQSNNGRDFICCCMLIQLQDVSSGWNCY